ncbi:MAG: hypothetical protein WC076_12205 [Terrimicrobiaceae bacterium]|jgi:hypothetical protein|nr:hypothetical protein [Terrimicrobiaceae bacterium]
MGHDRADIACQEMLMPSDAEDERAASAGPDHEVRNVRMENRDPIGSDHMPERLADRLDQAGLVAPVGTVEFVAHAVGQDFRVRLRHEGMAGFQKLFAEFLVVLDDPVVDEGEPPASIEVRVGIFLGDTPVRRPTGMADSGPAMHRALLDAFRKIRDAPDGLADFDRSPIQNGDTGRVISPVFQAPQPVEKHGERFRTANVTNNSTHKDFEP